jgi:adenylate cyclase
MSDEPIARPATSASPLLVAGWRVDSSTLRISKDGETVKLEPRAMAVLVYLAGRPGEAVTRDELEREVWDGVVVGYDALSNTIAKLRKAFGDDRMNPRVIETISKVGYRLIAEVGQAETAPPGAYHDGGPGLERKLAAIFYADVVGYSRLSGADEEGTHRALRASLDFITARVESYKGSVVNFAGDAVLAEFSALSDALACAVTLQQELGLRNEGIPEDRAVRYRIGVNLGEIIVDRDDIYGDGVNVAARLQSLAEPYDMIGHRLPLDYRFLGEQQVKNIAKPVRAYLVSLQSGAKLSPPEPASAARKPSKRWVPAIAAALALVAAVAVGATWFGPWDMGKDKATATRAVVPSDRPSIAVLPFTNLDDDPTQDHIADGMTDDLITDLSKIQELFVIGRHSVFTYNVRRVGGRVRVNAQLFDATTDSERWADHYDGEESDILALQDRIVGKIVSELSVKLTDAEKLRLSRRPTDNLEAYDYYLRAERSRLYGYGGMRHHQTIRLYQEAIALDPEFAEAYAGLAQIALRVWRWDGTNVMPNPVARKLAYESASQVLVLDPENPKAYSVLAMLQVTDSRHEMALQSAQKAVALDPNDAEAWVHIAYVLVLAGRHAEALEAMETALRLDPKPPAYFYGDMGSVLFFNRRYEEAAGYLEKTRDAGVDYLEELAMVYAELGRFDEANAVAKQLFVGYPFANLAYFRVLYGHYKRAEDLERVIEAFRKAGFPQWAYGYQPQPEDQLDQGALEALTFGQSWAGFNSEGDQFIQQFNKDGRVAFKSQTSLLIGTVRLEENKLCVKFPAALLDREDCGHVYKTPGEMQGHETDYVRVALGDIYYFSIDAD